MAEDDWEAGFAKALQMFLNGDAIPSVGVRGEPVEDDSFLLLFNADPNDLEFRVPSGTWGNRWRVAIDTAGWTVDEEAGPEVKGGDAVTLIGRSVVVLRRDG